MITPQLASPLELAHIGRYIVDDNWILEQKLDGHRLLLTLQPGLPPVAITRNGTAYTKGLPSAILNLRSFANPAIVLDGELVGDTYWAFDMLRGDRSWHARPLRERRAELEQFVNTTVTGPASGPYQSTLRSVPQARTAQGKERLLLFAAKHGMEGVVAKRADSVYTERRSPTWLKAKFVTTADVVVMGVRDDGKESASLGIYRNGRLVEIGRCSILGKTVPVVGSVVEVRYLYVNHPNAPRLYQPTLIRARKDKVAVECDGSDFRFTNKSVLHELP